MFVYYDECILSYVASIRNYYGLKSSYKSNEKLDAILKERKPKRIYQILIDAMGANMLERKLSDNDFLKKNMLFKTTSVFPATTTAATTSILNGKAPNENAWVGWVQYIQEVDDEIVPFYGKGYYSNEVYGLNYLRELIPVREIHEELVEIGVKARDLFPAFRPDGCASFEIMCERLKNYSHSEEYDFIYAYWEVYDSLVHKLGPDAPECDALLKEINDQLEKLAQEMSEDTMLIIMADHGQIEVTNIIDLEKTHYKDYLYHRPCVEPRAQAFYVKEEYKERFEKEFKEEFSDEFILLTKKQVLESHLFGDHENHPRFEEMIGDFLAVAKGQTAFCYKEKEDPYTFKGQHAGIHPDELMVPVIVYQK